jgi:hypothetical protein
MPTKEKGLSGFGVLRVTSGALSSANVSGVRVTNLERTASSIGRRAVSLCNCLVLGMFLSSGDIHEHHPGDSARIWLVPGQAIETSAVERIDRHIFR